LLAQEKPGQTAGIMALMHEAYLPLVEKPIRKSRIAKKQSDSGDNALRIPR